MLEPSFLCISFFVTIHIFSHFPIVVDFIYSNFLYRESISYLWNELQIFSSVLSFSFYLAYRRCCHVGTVLSGKIYQLFYDWVLYSTSCLSHSKIIKQFVCWVFFPWCFCDFILSLKYDPLQFVSDIIGLKYVLLLNTVVRWICSLPLKIWFRVFPI